MLFDKRIIGPDGCELLSTTELTSSAERHCSQMSM
jgi:hypothetical protein